MLLAVHTFVPSFMSSFLRSFIMILMVIVCRRGYSGKHQAASIAPTLRHEGNMAYTYFIRCAPSAWLSVIMMIGMRERASQLFTARFVLFRHF